MHLEHIGGGQYEVESESDGLPYHVDVLANDGKTVCHCRDYEVRRKPMINEKWIIDPHNPRPPYMCKHGWAAYLHFTTLIMPKLAKQINKGER